MSVERIAVVGAGVMGRGIAHAGALGGFEVRLHDADAGALEGALRGIEGEMKKAVERGKLDEEGMREGLRRISAAGDLADAVADADLVIEAVLEKMDLKLSLFGQFDELCPEHAVLATNTSTMSPTEIAAGTERPGRCIAMHFFNPAHKMKLVELIRGVETTDETVETARETAERMGKESVEVYEFPGFVTSRINCLVGNEAMNMMVEGVASASDTDKALKLGLGYPMGPLELADLVGLDTRLRNLEYLHETLGEKYRPSPLLRKRVAAGHSGKKSGRGIYEYDADGNKLRLGRLRMAEYETILTGVEGGVGTITINRPDVRNALNTQVVGDLRAALTEFRYDGSVGVVVFTGAGDRAFAAGADIGELREKTMLDALGSTMQQVYDEIEGYEKPTVAAVNGYALGGGCELAMACDIRIASENARFGLPEVALSIIPGAGGTQRLARLVGKGKAIEMVLTGRMISAEEALRVGLVTQVVSPEKLPVAARETANDILSKGPLAVRLAKLAVHAGFETDQKTGLVIERLAQAVLFTSEDKREGTSAFVEKREPNFEGR